MRHRLALLLVLFASLLLPVAAVAGDAEESNLYVGLVATTESDSFVDTGLAPSGVEASYRFGSGLTVAAGYLTGAEVVLEQGTHEGVDVLDARVGYEFATGPDSGITPFVSYATVDRPQDEDPDPALGFGVGLRLGRLGLTVRAVPEPVGPASRTLVAVGAGWRF